MHLKSHRAFKYLLLCISIAFLLPALSHADIEKNIVVTSSGFYYVIQKGDTLWDLSERFSDSPWQWPDMWQHNPDIPNPHLIYPGQRIQVYRKSWEDLQARHAVLQEDIRPPEPDDKFYSYTKIHAIGFIRETAADNYGSVIKVKDDKSLISTGDRIFIGPAEGSEQMANGALYTVYRTTGPVTDPVTRDYIGIQHIVTGVVEIVQVEEEFAVASIIMSYRDIRTGDVILPFQVKSDKIRLGDSIPHLTGRIIKGEEGQALIGEHSVAFINKGSNDFVESGQVYTLFYQESATPDRIGASQIMLTEETLGELLVLHTEATTSTVLITNSIDQIADGTAFKATDR